MFMVYIAQDDINVENKYCKSHNHEMGITHNSLICWCMYCIILPELWFYMYGNLHGLEVCICCASVRDK